MERVLLYPSSATGIQDIPVCAFVSVFLLLMQDFEMRSWNALELTALWSSCFNSFCWCCSLFKWSHSCKPHGNTFTTIIELELVLKYHVTNVA